MGSHKISFCTVCMNRLSHLMQTLPANLSDNCDYPNLELVLLDYNSSDNLEEYVKSRLQEPIRTGRLIYYKTLTPKYFNRSHSRNLAFQLASGDIICNIDADNYTGKGFASYVNSRFCESSDIFMTTLNVAKINFGSDVYGRVCLKKEDFVHVRGFDESMRDYGYEDFDLVNRLEMRGVNRHVLEDGNYLKVIVHTTEDRICNEEPFQNFERLFFNYLTPISTDFLFLFKDKTFRRGLAVINSSYAFSGSRSELQKMQAKYEYSILEEGWITGRWRMKDKIISLIYLNGGEECLYACEVDHPLSYTMRRKNGSDRYYEILDHRMIEDAIFFYCGINNRILKDQNLLQQKSVVNEGGFGRGTIYKNFDYGRAINIE